MQAGGEDSATEYSVESLCLLELVGQVPPSERLSSDSLLVETVKAWT